MNLDEAIKRAKEVASEQKRRSGLCATNDNECDKFSSCIKCAEEHEQLAEWLTQLKEYQKLEKRLKDIFGGDDFPLSVFVESFDTVLKEGKSRFTLRFLLTKTPINGMNIKNWKNRAGS